MITRLRDRLTILMALAAIFLCGYGIGFLVGEKDGRKNAPALTLPSMDQSGPESWESRTFEQLNTALELTPEQASRVKVHIKKSAAVVRRSQLDSLKIHAHHLIQLQSEIMPILNPEQKQKIRIQRDKLREGINLSLPKTGSPQ